MNLIQKAHSIWEGSSLTKKGKLCLSLTAIGIMGGFFVLQAVNEIHITAPHAGEFVRGTEHIAWDTAICSTTVTKIDVKYSSGGSPVTLATYVTCSEGGYNWDTTNVADGSNYQIFVYNADNYSMNGLSGTFTVDNTVPAITAGTLISPNGEELWGGTAKNVTWNQAAITDTNLGTTSIDFAYSIDGTNWISIATGEANDGTYSWALPSINSEAVKVKVIATDLAGNKSSDESDATFKIDTAKPTATVSVNAGTVSDGNRTKIVTVTYNEKMDVNVSPLITLGAGSWAVAAGVWSVGDTVWTRSFTITDNNEEATANIVVNGGKDVAGNDQAEGTLSNAFAIDTRNPVVDNAVAIPALAKAGIVNVAVKFSENMDTTISPIVQITGLTGSPIAVTKSSYSGIDWAGTFSLADNNEIATATISITGGADVNGNVAISDSSKTFSVDTVEPVAAFVVLDTPKISDADLTQKVTVTYSEAMSAAPTISFSAGSFSSVGSGLYDTDKKVWTQDFGTTDLGQELSGITATASGAADLAGNVQASLTSAGTFAIDTLNPTVALSDGGELDNIVRNGDTILFTATFSEVVIDPKISINTTGIDVENAAMIIGVDGTITYSWVVPTGNDGATTVSISAKDIAGNLNVAATGETLYTIDNIPPVVTIDSLVTKDTTPTISGTMNDSGATVKIVVNGAPYNTQKNTLGTGWTAEITTPILIDGDYDIIATITDIVENSGVDSSTNELKIDTGVPTITVLTSPVAGVVYKAGVPLTFTATDSATAVTCSYKIDGGNAVDVPCTNNSTPNVAINSLSDGKHSIVVTVVDAATNSFSSGEISFIVDTNNTLTVGATGADFTTISTAIAAASNNDTISVAAGTYTENIIIPAEKTGLKIIGHGKADTFINAHAGTGEANEKVFDVKAPVTIQGFAIDCNGQDYGIASAAIDGVIIKDNAIGGYYKNGIYADDGGLLIDGNTITGRTSTNFSVDSIYTRGGVTATINGNTLSGNIFANIAGGTSAGISIHAGDNVTLTNNIIIGNSIGIHAKSGSTVNAKGKNNISGNVYNFYFEDDNAALTESFDISENWWGNKVYSEIATKMFNISDFGSWYLDAEMTNLSGGDTIDPNVVITTDDADGIVKAGDNVTITATVTDANGIDGRPQITLSSGELVAVPMDYVSGNDWKATWTAPIGDGTMTISVLAYDAVRNDGTGTKDLKIDNTAPTFTIDDNVADGPVKTDTIKITVADINGVTETKYGFSVDEICNVSDTYDNIFTSGTAFEIAGDHTNYLCAKATDTVGNIGYKLVGKLNTDNTAPAAPVVTLTDPVTSGNQTTVAITGTGEADAAIVWKISDIANGAVSGTGSVSSAGVISITSIDVTSLADGILTLSVTATDAAENGSAVGTDTATKDAVVPTVTNVTSEIADGSYTVGTLIKIQVGFSEKVIVTGTPQLELETGTTDRKADYSPGTGTDTLTFNYTAQAGDTSSDFDYTGTGALIGTITDISGNAATLTLPTPGAVGSLGANKNIVIDTTAPSGSVTIDQTSINSSNKNTLSFTFAGAEVGSIYEYTISDSSTLKVTGTGTILSAIDQIKDINVSTLADGVLTLSVTLTDAAVNVGTLSPKEVNKDTTAPIFDAFADIEVPATDKNGTVVTYVPIALGATTITCNPASGSLFEIKTTSVTCTAKDAADNSSTLTFNVTVKDKTAPIIGSHEDITTVEATSPSGAVVTYTNPTATDNVDTSVTVVCTLSSGSTFPIGETTVTCNAKDAALNSATPTTFIVKVQDTIAPKIVNLTPVNLSTTSSGTPTVGAQFEESGSGINVSSIVFSLAEYADANAFAVKTATGVSYTPSLPLANNTYHATVTVSDIAGHSTSQSWIFVMNKAVSSVDVSTSTTSVAANGTSSATITATVLNNGIPAVGATVSFASTIGTFSGITTTNAQGQVAALLKSSVAGTTLITVTYNSGNGMVQGTNDTLKFTAIAVDTTAPTATSVPLNLATGVLVNASPVITFSELMDLGTLTDTNIQLRKYTTNEAIPAVLTVSTSGSGTNVKTVVTLDPTSALDLGAKYYFYIDGVKDVTGNEFVSWIKDSHTFTTIADANTANITLKVGWNLISLPLIPNSESITVILGGLPVGSVDIVQSYDTQTGIWSNYKPTVGGTLLTMEDGKGYWIKMNSLQTLTITGTELPAGGITMPLSYTVYGNKWNLIGYKSTATKTAGEYMSQMGSDDVLWVFRNEKYESLSKTDLMNPGFGYWFYTYKPAGFDIIPK